MQIIQRKHKISVIFNVIVHILNDLVIIWKGLNLGRDWYSTDEILDQIYIYIHITCISCAYLLARSPRVLKRRPSMASRPSTVLWNKLYYADEGNARAAENWDTRQALLRELVPGQSRSASPLPFLIRIRLLSTRPLPRRWSRLKILRRRWSARRRITQPSRKIKDATKKKKEERKKNRFHTWKVIQKSGWQWSRLILAVELLFFFF